MPESPEVDALAVFLDGRLAGHRIAAVELIEFRALKTRTAPLDGLVGARIAAVGRRGKHLDIALDGAAAPGGLHLVVSLGRHGWVRWTEAGAVDLPGVDPDMRAADEPPTLASVTLDDGGLMEFTDAGSWVSLGLSIVGDPTEVSAIAKLGPDPADAAFTRDDFRAALGGRRKQIKAILQEQESLAGIGNAYSDEILHAAKLSPVEHAAALSDDDIERLYESTVATLRDAVVARRGVAIDQLKSAKVTAMRVHGRTGETCPVCGGTVRDFRFGSTTAQYCPTCQTGGTELAMRG